MLECTFPLGPMVRRCSWSSIVPSTSPSTYRSSLLYLAVNFHGFPDAGLAARTVRLRGLKGHTGQRCFLLFRWFHPIRRRSRRLSWPWSGSLFLATFVEDTQGERSSRLLIDSPSIGFHVLCWLNANVQAAMDTGFLRLLSVTIFSLFNDVFGYPRTHNRAAARLVSVRRARWRRIIGRGSMATVCRPDKCGR